MKTLRPTMKAPDLSVPLVQGGTWNLEDQTPELFTMLVFYRGLHCPLCSKQLQELQELLPKYKELGVEPIAISGDDEARARKSAEDWGIDRLPLGYGMSEEDMQVWNLYLSKGIKEGEPKVFGEPGLFMIRPDQTIYSIVLNSMPFGRPNVKELLPQINFVRENDYPARGELEYAEARQ